MQEHSCSTPTEHAFPVFSAQEVFQPTWSSTPTVLFNFASPGEASDDESLPDLQVLASIQLLIHHSHFVYSHASSFMKLKNYARNCFCLHNTRRQYNDGSNKLLT